MRQSQGGQGRSPDDVQWCAYVIVTCVVVAVALLIGLVVTS